MNLQVNYQLDNALNSFIRLSTRPTPRSGYNCKVLLMENNMKQPRTTTTRPTPSTTTLSPRQQMVLSIVTVLETAMTLMIAIMMMMMIRAICRNDLLRLTT